MVKINLEKIITVTIRNFFETKGIYMKDAVIIKLAEEISDGVENNIKDAMYDTIFE